MRSLLFISLSIAITFSVNGSDEVIDLVKEGIYTDKEAAEFGSNFKRNVSKVELIDSCKESFLMNFRQEYYLAYKSDKGIVDIDLENLISSSSKHIAKLQCSRWVSSDAISALKKSAEADMAATLIMYKGIK